ncbi:helix-turn-helix domain-containing protein [Oscillospiraceae bacterium 44-34]
MTLGERIKKVRKDLDLTQQAFADRLGMKRNSIAQVEMGRNTSDQTIISICREFGISETWLRTGEGDMKAPGPEESVDELIQEHGLDNLDRQIILEFIKLKPEDRESVKRYVRNLAQHLPAVEQAAQPMTIEQEVDQEVERYRQQLISEKKQASQALSAKESDVG